MSNILIYIDPGSGSYLLQMIIAAILGGLFYFKNLWWRIKSFFTGNKPTDTGDSGYAEKEEDKN